MQKKSMLAAFVVIGLLPLGPSLAQVAGDELELQQLSAALRSNDKERQAAIATCIKQGIGHDLAAIAKVMDVPVESATQAWCTRMTNGIANGKLKLADIEALSKGTVTPSAREVLVTVSGGK